MKSIFTAIKASIYAGNEIMKVYSSDNFDINIKTDNSPLTKADVIANKTIIDILSQTELPVISEESPMTDFEIRSKFKKYWLIDPLDGTKEFIKRNGEFTVNIALIENNKTVAGVVYAPAIQELFFGNTQIGAYKLENISLQNFNHIDINSIIKSSVKLPVTKSENKIVVISSKSHSTPENEKFIKNLELKHNNIKTLTKGSSLKICILAEGKAHIYPRFGPTSEWDTAAAHAVLKAAGGNLYHYNNFTEIFYNKQNILNSFFIAIAPNFNLNILKTTIYE